MPAAAAPPVAAAAGRGLPPSIPLPHAGRSVGSIGVLQRVEFAVAVVEVGRRGLGGEVAAAAVFVVAAAAAASAVLAAVAFVG